MNNAADRKRIAGLHFPPPRVPIAILLLLVAGAGRSFGKSGDQPNFDSSAVLGFESTSDWHASKGQVSPTAQRTQGSAAYSLENPGEESHLKSETVSLSAPALLGIGDPGASFAIDVSAPPKADGHGHDGDRPDCDGDDDDDKGSLELSVNVPSRGIHGLSLGRVEFKQGHRGAYRTLKFAVTHELRRALGNGSCDDLSFELTLRAGGGRSGIWSFDNLRVHSPGMEPVAAGQSVDLTSRLAYSPAESTPGYVTFPVGIVQVPRSFHLTLGSARTQDSALLELGFGETPSIICTYRGGADGTSYDLASCAGNQKAGDLVSAEFARLTIASGDPSAGTTKIRAQLALNPVGDIAGAGVIPPMPTFWGDTPDSASQIITDYTNAFSTRRPSEEQWVKTPVPDFARRSGDGAPVNLLVEHPPPGDPPFSSEGHLGSGNWDAYYRLEGFLANQNTPDHHSVSDLSAQLSAHAVVWGQDIEVVRVAADVHSDSGALSTSGFSSPSASGGLHMIVLGGIEVPGGGDHDASEGFTFTADTSKTYNLASIHIWIFAINFGVNASLSLTASGNFSPGGFAVNVTPAATAGASISGGIDIGIASGEVEAIIDLIAVSTPINASVSWVISTDPAVCAISLDYVLDGQLVISTLGGRVDLVAEFGDCPFCYHHTWPLFAWDPLASKTWPLFHFTNTDTPVVHLGSLCQVPLNVFIQEPQSNDSFIASVGTTLQGSAARPSTAVLNGTSGEPPPYSTPVPCEQLVWTSSDSSDPNPLAVGCTPLVKFATPGLRTLTLSATDQYGETGSASRSINVTALPQELTAFIDTPVDGYTFVGGKSLILQGHATANGAVVPADCIWSITHSDGTCASGTCLSLGCTAVLQTDRVNQDYTATLFVGYQGAQASKAITVSSTVVQ